MPAPTIVGYDQFGNPLYGNEAPPSAGVVPPGAVGLDQFGIPIYPEGADTTVTFDQGPSNQRASHRGATEFEQWLFDNMTPEQQADFIARGEVEQRANPQGVQAPQLAFEKHLEQTRGAGYMTPQQWRAYENNRRTQDTARQNEIELKKLQNLANESRAGNQAAVDEMGRLIDAQDPRNAAYVQQSRALADELSGARNTANQMSLDALGEYGGTLRALNASNAATIGQLNSVYDQLGTPIAADLAFDPQARAAQNEALGFFQGGMNGALDYRSQAAGAYADPRYVAMRDQGLADLYGVSQGSKDVAVGEADPAAYAHAMRALEQASELTNPAVTDKENFLYEQARQRWESEMRGAAAAKMSNLRRRGLAGGGAELTSTALTNADISQKRVLADLAASAGAVDRASEMLKLKGALATNLNDAGNALATGNANRQLQALGLYQQGAETAQQSSFDQEYKRGVAADNASANNQQTRLQSGIAYGNQANTMQEQSMDLDWRNKQIEIGERDALWGRATDRAGMTLNANAQTSNNASNLFQGTTSVANNNYVRDRDVVQAKDLSNTREWAGHQGQLDRRLGVQGQQIGINNTNTGVQSGVIGQNLANNQWTHNALLENARFEAGEAASNRAATDAAIARIDADEKAGKTGILGLPVIGSSDYGAFNLFGLGGVRDYDAEREAVRQQGRG